MNTYKTKDNNLTQQNLLYEIVYICSQNYIRIQEWPNPRKVIGVSTELLIELLQVCHLF